MRIFEIRIITERLENPFPDSLLRPAREVVQTVNHSPNASGKLRHGERVRAIQRTASIKGQLSRRLLPGSPAAPDSPGAIGFQSRLISISLESIFNRIESLEESVKSLGKGQPRAPPQRCDLIEVELNETAELLGRCACGRRVPAIHSSDAGARLIGPIARSPAPYVSCDTIFL